MADKIVVLNAGTHRADRQPARALSSARQHFRRRLHRQPEDEFPVGNGDGVATDGNVAVDLGKARHHQDCRAAAIADLVGKTVTVGIRPEHLALGEGKFSFDGHARASSSGSASIRSPIARWQPARTSSALFEGDPEIDRGQSASRSGIDPAKCQLFDSDGSPCRKRMLERRSHAAETFMLDLVGLLRLEKETFSRSERRLIDVVLADVDVALNSSIVELAALADVSPPTVTRFCRRLGCESFAAFKVRLAQSRFLGQRYFAAAGSDRKRCPTSPAASSTACSRRSTNSSSSIDVDAVERAAARIVKASYVLTFGSGGASSMIALELENRLFRLGLKVAASVDHQGAVDARGGCAEGHGDRRLVDERQQCAACQGAGDCRLLRHHPHRHDAAGDAGGRRGRYPAGDRLSGSPDILQAHRRRVTPSWR